MERTFERILSHAQQQLFLGRTAIGGVAVHHDTAGQRAARTDLARITYFDQYIYGQSPEIQVHTNMFRVLNAATHLRWVIGPGKTILSTSEGSSTSMKDLKMTINMIPFENYISNIPSGGKMGAPTSQNYFGIFAPNSLFLELLHSKFSISHVNCAILVLTCIRHLSDLVAIEAVPRQICQYDSTQIVRMASYQLRPARALTN